MKLGSNMKGVVLGCGTAGMAMVRFLLDQGVEVAVSDMRHASQLTKEIEFFRAKEVEFETGRHRESFVFDADFIAVSPGIALDVPLLVKAKVKGIALVGELMLAEERFPGSVVGITGSNGKTTVTTLLGSLLQQQYQDIFIGGNVGTPLLNCFTEKIGGEWAVLELSSFQLELPGEFRPDISMLLNVSPDHLDRHHTLKGYMEAKLNLCKKQHKGDVAIIGGEDPLLASAKVSESVQVFRFGHEEEHDAVIAKSSVRLRYQYKGEKVDEVYDLQPTALTSHVNLLNSGAAILAARLAGCGYDAITRGLAAYTPPLHRMTPVAEIDGVMYVNDSKATNVGALQAALQGSSEPVVLIAGGRDKDGEFSILCNLVSEKVKHLILLGEAAGTMEDIFQGFVSLEQAGSMEEAVKKAEKIASRGDMVLLAPGCASFDMFSGYEERGRVFTENVLRLKKKEIEVGQ